MAYIRKLSSGNYQVQVRLKGLKPITRTFSTKTLAKEFAREIEGNSEMARKLGICIYGCIYGDTHFGIYEHIRGHTLLNEYCLID